MTTGIQLDGDRVAALRRMGGDKLVRRMFDSLLSNAPKMIAEAKEACSRGDLATVGRMGHSLKSSAAQMGVGALRDVAARLEESAAAGRQTDEIVSILAEMEQAWTQAVPLLLDGNERHAP